jgi:hypothetical protein
LQREPSPDPTEPPQTAEEPTPDPTLELIGQLGRGRLGATWVARGRHAAKRMALPDGRTSGDVLRDARELTQLRDPALLPIEEVRCDGRDAWVFSELDPGVPLRRLLAVTVLTPRQAAAVIQSAFHGLDALHVAGLAHGQLHANNVHVSTDGRIRLGDWGLRRLVSGARIEREQHADLIELATLLRRMVGEGRRMPAWRSPEAERLAWAVASLAPEGDALREGLASVRQAAVALLRDGGRAQAEAELGALVTSILPGRPRTISAPAQPASFPPTPRPVGQAWPIGPRPLAALAAVAIGMVAAGLSLTLLHGGGQTAERATVQAPAASPAVSALPSTAPTAPTPTPLPPVPGFGPTKAGPITGVEIRQLGGDCAPGGDCQLRVFVHLNPTPASQPVSWRFKIVDRCTGTVSDVPGVTLTAQPTWPYVYGTTTLTLPQSKSLGVVAVSDAPASAASPPFLIPSSGGAC